MAATTVDTLLVRIEADMSGIRRDLRRLEQTTQQSSQRMTKAVSGFSRTVGPLLGAALVGAVTVGSSALVKLASDVEEMQAKSSVVFGQFASTVREQLSVFADEVNRSAFELEAMAASVQDTFVPLGFARGEAADLSVQLTKLATDVASFNNESDPSVMAAFQSALVGNHEAVRRFGIVITQAELEAELFRMGITKNAKEVDAATKVQARLNLILAGTTDAQGDAARTSDSFANQLRGLQADAKDLGVEIGQKLTPIFIDLMHSASAVIETFRQLLLTFKLIDGTPAEQISKLNKELDKLIKRRENLIKIQEIEKEGIGFGSAPETTRRQIEEVNRQIEANRMLIKSIKTLQELQDQAPVITIDKGQKETKEVTEDATNALEAFRQELFEARLEQSTFTDAQKMTLIFAKQNADATADQIIEYHALAEELLKLSEVMEEELNPMMVAQQRAIEGLSDSLSSNLADMAMSGKFNLESLQSSFKSFTKTILQEAIKLSIINPLLNRMFNPTQQFSTAQGGVLGTIASAIGGTGRAGGGSISAPTIVGERGPELFVPHSAGVIKNAHATRGMMGGSPVVVNQNLNIETGVAQTVRAEILTMMPMIQNSTLSAVQNARQRGGSFAASFGG